VNNKLEKMGQEPVVDYFEVLPRNFPRGTEENLEKFQHGLSFPPEIRTGNLPNTS
jgi:hypothetical protein